MCVALFYLHQDNVFGVNKYEKWGLVIFSTSREVNIQIDDNVAELKENTSSVKSANI